MDRRGVEVTPGQEQRDLRRRQQLRDVIILAIMLAVITALHTFTNDNTTTQRALHDFYRRLYYVPILYAAFIFGLRGGLATAVASALLYAPYVSIGTAGLFGLPPDNVLEMVMYFAMGTAFGRLRDIEEKRTSDLRQVSSKLEDAYRVLEERAMQLISIQDYTQSILRSVTSGVVTVGPDASIATVNPAAERILGVNEEQLVARALGATFRDDGGLTLDVRKVLEGRSPRTMRDVTLTTAGGKVVHTQASVSRMRDIGGRKLGAVVTIEDVSDIRALTDQLIRADRLAAMGELTAGVAHEVRNPLGIIRASVQLMEDAECSRERVHEAAEVIKQEIDRLDKVIKALLDFGRPAQPTMRPVDVRQVLEEVVLFSRTFASRGKVDIAEEYGPGVPDVFADPEQLKQVFVNLISNAVQAMAETGGDLVVATGADDGFVFVRFTDDGPGIEADMLGKVFDPFVSTRDDGTGLGLTIVHRIVDDHDGHIEVASEPGAGTAFTVWLPALQ
ncbi:MAG: ATP-binding protein [Coriobacteriia bacterium]|nr:ATP-binding protein [Coriobacteriia bacterium]